MPSCIKCNKFNKFFKYILFTTLFRYLNTCIIGYNHNETFEKVSLSNFIFNCFNSESPFNISNYKITEYFLNFFGIFFFSLFTRLYELHLSGLSIKNFFKLNDSYKTIQRELIQTELKGLQKKENFLHRFKNYIMNNSSFKFYFIISFIWVSNEIVLQMFSIYLKDLDLWIFEILIVTIIYSKIFLLKVYNHQKLAIGLNILPTILKVTCIILSFYSNDPRIYTEYPWWICIGLISYLIFLSISGFINCTIKSFLDLKYSTTSQILMFYSSVGIFVSFFICIISSYAPCSKIEDSNLISTNNCKIEKNGYRYFENIIEYFDSFTEEILIDQFIRSFIIILDAITYFFQKYFFILAIKFTDPVNITFSSPILFIIKKIVLIVNNLILDKECFKDTSNHKVDKFFCDISGDIICLFGYLIYLEIIELNCYNLNYNLKKSIAIRGMENDLYILDFSEQASNEENHSQNKEMESIGDKSSQ